MVKIEQNVDTKISCEANIESQPYFSARIEPVLPAGIPDIITQILANSGSKEKGFSMRKMNTGNTTRRSNVK